MRDLIVAALAVLAFFALSCAAAYHSRALTIQMYRDAFPEETKDMTDEEIMDQDDFKNIY